MDEEEGLPVPAEPGVALLGLASMAQALGRSQSLFRVLEIAAEEVLTALDAASTTVSRIDPGTAVLRTIINVGELGPEEDRWPLDEVYPIRDIGTLSAVVDDRVTWTAHLGAPDSDPFELQLLRTLGKGAGLGAPVVVDGHMWGELYATRHHGQVPFGPDDVAYVQVLIAILGGAISRCLREASLQELAFRDSLTGLLNRRALDVHAAQVFDVPAGTNRPVTAVMLDINGLKQVNDSLGHAVGDQFIRSVAQELHTAFSGITGSQVARVGGDEFSVLVSGQEAPDVIEVIDALCARTWKFVSGPAISAGAASMVLTDRSRITPAALFSAADRAQYVAKRRRQTTTHISSELTPVSRWLRAAPDH
jgi:diguanylate cyclase (GGDEF)-like protein